MSIVDVTTQQSFATLSDAITGSAAGDVIDVSAGTYVEEFPLITHSLTIEGVGGMAHLVTPGATPANNRAILFVQGNADADLTVRNLEMSGATDPASNGAGILFEVGNGNLAISHCWFHDNEDGILVGSQPAGTVSIDSSEFGNNGLAPSDPRYGFSHNLYVNEVGQLTITNSSFHGARGGHEIKSRALVTSITGNRIEDGADNSASYSIDIPNGGLVTIAENVIEKGPLAANRYTVHFGGEFNIGPTSYAGSALTLRDNILINDRVTATALLNQTADAAGVNFPVSVTGNQFYGFDTLYQASNASPADMFANNQFSPALCYAPGTAILTEHGPRAIESLQPGARVVTRFGGLRPICWIGRQSFDPRFGHGSRAVRIQAGALGPDVPARDLFVSPGHSMLIDGRLILARNLVNGITITQPATQATIEYYQLDLFSHDCILAEGAWSETFADGPGLRGRFCNAAGFAERFPGYTEPAEISLCAPRPERGPELAASLAPVVARAARGTAIGPMRGQFDAITSSGHAEGWAQDMDNPDLPVLLEFVANGAVMAKVLACDPRADLKSAGIGRGDHAFSVAVAPEYHASLQIRRAADQAQLHDAARRRAA